MAQNRKKIVFTEDKSNQKILRTLLRAALANEAALYEAMSATFVHEFRRNTTQTQNQNN